MEIMIRRNWWGKFLIYEADSDDYSYYGHSWFAWGNVCKIYNRQKEQVLHLKEGKIGRFFKPSDRSFLIKVITDNIDFELQCADNDSHWTFKINDDKFDLVSFDTHKKLLKNDNHVATYRTDYNFRRIIKATEDADKLVLISLATVFQISNE